MKIAILALIAALLTVGPTVCQVTSANSSDMARYVHEKTFTTGSDYVLTYSLPSTAQSKRTFFEQTVIRCTAVSVPVFEIGGGQPTTAALAAASVGKRNTDINPQLKVYEGSDSTAPSAASSRLGYRQVADIEASYTHAGLEFKAGAVAGRVFSIRVPAGSGTCTAKTFWGEKP